MIKLFRINTGSCGACDAELIATVARTADLAWAADPYDADVLIVTGVFTAKAKPAFQALLSELNGQVPVLAVGRCTIDGYPYGRGGLADNPDVVVAAKVSGCPPPSQELIDAIRALRRP